MKAIVFVDVQNDFVKGGKLAFGYPVEDNVQKLISFAIQCRNRGDMLYATQDTHEQTVYDNSAIPANAAIPQSKAISGYLTTLEGQNLPIEHCVENTYGWNIVTGLTKDIDGNVIIPCGHIVEKPTFGSFDLLARIDQDFVVDSYGNLTCQSRYDGIGEKLDEIIICGYDLAICVISNALMLRAKYPNVKITIKKDLCGCISEETFNAALCVAKCCQINIE